MKRDKFIGGSDVAAILGLSRYKTPYEVWDSKKNGNNPFSGNQFTEWGTRIEPVIIGKFEDEHNCIVYNNNDKFLMTEHPFLGCHPDGIATINGERVLLEVKTVSKDAHRNWDAELPLEYYCQVQHNLMVTGLKKAHFVFLILDSRQYNEIVINYDDDFIAEQKGYLINWWERFIIGDEIPSKLVQDYERDSPERDVVEADSEALLAHAELVRVKEAIKALKEEQEGYEDILKLKIGEATDLMNKLKPIATWRPQTRTGLDTIKFKEEEPTLYLKYVKETKSRSFLVKTIKE